MWQVINRAGAVADREVRSVTGDLEGQRRVIDRGPQLGMSQHVVHTVTPIEDAPAVHEPLRVVVGTANAHPRILSISGISHVLTPSASVEVARRCCRRRCGGHTPTRSVAVSTDRYGTFWPSHD